MQKSTSVELYSTLIAWRTGLFDNVEEEHRLPQRAKNHRHLLLFPLSSCVILSCAAKKNNNQSDLWKDNNSLLIYWRQNVFLQVIESSCVWMIASVNMKSSFSVPFLCYFQKDKKSESYRKSTGNKTGGGRAALTDILNLNIFWFVLFMKGFYCRTGWGSGQYPKSSQDYLKLAGENAAFQWNSIFSFIKGKEPQPTC